MFVNTVRARAELEARGGLGAARIWWRIFSQIAVMLCVVKMLASAISCGGSPARKAERSARSGSVLCLGRGFLRVAALVVVAERVGSSGRPVASWRPRATTRR